VSVLSPVAATGLPETGDAASGKTGDANGALVAVESGARVFDACAEVDDGAGVGVGSASSPPHAARIAAKRAIRIIPDALRTQRMEVIDASISR
jgi:hypothetical protein